jgi:GntR family transcriptional regulator/MocR family aminotransferase
MHFVMTLPNIASDRQIASIAAKEKMWLLPLSPCYSGKDPRQGFIMGFGSMPANQMARSVRKLRTILDSAT